MSNQETEDLWLKDTFRIVVSDMLVWESILLVWVLSFFFYFFESNSKAMSAAWTLFNAGLLLFCGPQMLGSSAKQRNLFSKRKHFGVGVLACLGCVSACSQLLPKYTWFVGVVFVWCGFLMLWTFSQFQYWKPRRLLVSRHFLMGAFLGLGICAPIATALAPGAALTTGWILSVLMGVGILVQYTAIWYLERYARDLVPEQHPDVWLYLLAKDSWFVEPDLDDVHVSIRVAMKDEYLEDSIHEDMLRRMDWNTAQWFLDELEYCEKSNSQLIYAAQKRLSNMQDKTLAETLDYLNKYGTQYLNSGRLSTIVDAARQRVCLLEPRAQVVFAVYPDIKAAVQEIERMLVTQEAPETLALPDNLEFTP